MIPKIQAEEIQELIRKTAAVDPGIKIEVFDTLNSTNEYIFDSLQTRDFSDKTAIIAGMQTAGKGRQGRVWVSPPGNIYLSYYWLFQGPLDKLYGLSLAAGIAVARVLKRHGLEDVKLKWPNDIFWNGHKMGGILIETKTKAPDQIHTVIGLGLNILPMQEYKSQISQKFVDLENALQQKIYKNQLIAELLIEFDKITLDFSMHGFEGCADEWKSYDAQISTIQSEFFI